MLLKFFTARFHHWLSKRRVSKKSHRLEQQNLFIFPSKLGGVYLFLMIFIWLLGTNYDNNLILGLSYLFVSLLLISIFHSYYNLQALDVSLQAPEPLFSGESVAIKVQFKKVLKREHQNIHIGWSRVQHLHFTGQDSQTTAINWVDKASGTATLSLIATQRGEYQLPRLSISSTYPFGLVRCWCELSMDAVVLVYPTALNSESAKISQPSDSQALQENRGTSDQALEYQELQRYQIGESLSKISWKHYARTGTLLVKNFQGGGISNTELSWYHYPDVAVEKRLQYLCYQALHLDAQQLPFSLVLPNVELQAASSKQHLHAVLSALALYDSPQLRNS